MAFEKFKNHIVEIGNKGLKHTFYRLSESEILNIEKEISIPNELKIFYSTVGHGFMYDSDSSYSINRLLSPQDFLKINLRRDYYEFDPTLEIYNSKEFSDLLIFFEVIEGNYLLIDKHDVGGKNSIYYINEKITSSLEEFLNLFDENPNYFG